MRNLFLIILAAFSLTSFSQIGQKNFIDQNYIEVSGKAEMEIIPNEIYLKIIIDEKDLKNKSSLDETEKLMIKKLKDIDIDVSKNLAIKDMVSNFRNYWIIGSTINAKKEYQLMVNNATTAGRVFQELEKIGISNISIEKIDHSDIQKFKNEVKINAIKAAKEKAGSLSDAIGQKIGKAIFIQEFNPFMHDTFQGKSAGMSNIVVRAYGHSGKSAAQPEPEIEFEKIKLEYSILARFELLP
ncbi:SIMPL domain-containing protein [Anaerophaga thermohalophila]|jgi:hypothetical protein|uniref:SIMPL domain-containing protein n=1 Tax=Anaerophaga thermohalophila TaxID=177400 RepID=UPI0005C49903|nr:SIMPL domain-containing protein [Anaerophaga thermohalophila]